MRSPRSTLAPRALAAALALALAAGCAKSDEASCPGGATIGVFALQGRRVDAATACAAGPDGGWAAAVPATLPLALETDPTATFTVTLSGDAVTGTVALCRGGSHAAVLEGTRTGDHLRLEAAGGTGVLAPCAATCTAGLTTVVEGDLVPDASGGPLRFTGTWVERMEAVAGSACGPCTLPCTATYTIEGVAR